MNVRDLKRLPPDELEKLMAEMPEEDAALLQEHLDDCDGQMAKTMADFVSLKRSEAIMAKRNSGIEEEWLEDEEYYEGIDDANRSGTYSDKPPGRLDISDDDSEEADGSTIFLNITRPYCDAAGASLADMLLPTDDSAWQITHTPVPELIPVVSGQLPDAVRQAISQDVGGDQAKAHEVEQKMIQQAKQILEQAKDKAEKAQKRIEDWHVECQYHREVRKVIEDAARIGSGVLKGPVPQKRKQVAYKDGALIVQEEIKPGSKHISYRNLYPAKGCGEDIHSGSYIFEKDDISSKKLRELIGTPGYIDEEILKVLDEGPTMAKEVVSPVDEMRRDTSGLFEIWYFHGEITNEEMEAVFDRANYEDDTRPETPDSQVVSAQVTMVNNRVIKAAINPLDTGDFPYDVMVWQCRKGLPWGIGVSRHIRTPQRMINAAARNLMDNAGLAGGPMWMYNPDVVVPEDDNYSIYPRKGWRQVGDIDDIRKAFSFLTIDMRTDELQAIIYLGLKMAEDVTGLPMLMQGQMGAQKLDTLGQTQILNNNANIVRRRIARLFDDLVTEPHVRRYYTYLLQYGKDDEKGEFVVDARGSSNLVERAMQKEQSMELLEASKDPTYGIDPKKAMKEYLRSQKLDPKSYQFDDEEWQEVVRRLAQPQQQDPRGQIAQLNAQVAQMKEQAHNARTQAEIDSNERMQQRDQQLKVALEQFNAQLDKELEAMKHQGARTINTENLKVKVHESTQKLLTQIQLADQGPAPQVATPMVEPPGRARDGMAFQQ